MFIYSHNPNLVKNASPGLEILALETKSSTTVSVTPKTLCPSFLSILCPWTNYGRKPGLFTQSAEPGAPSQGEMRPLCRDHIFFSVRCRSLHASCYPLLNLCIAERREKAVSKVTAHPEIWAVQEKASCWEQLGGADNVQVCAFPHKKPHAAPGRHDAAPG